MAFGDINNGMTIELTQDQLNAIIKQTLLAAHPVGSIYQSLDSTSPDVLFGGTWEKLENKFLLAAYDGCTAGNIGGEAEHTLTISEMPRHQIELLDQATDSSNAFLADDQYWAHVERASKGTKYWWSYSKPVGGSQPHNNMPPYVAVWTWKRTA